MASSITALQSTLSPGTDATASAAKTPKDEFMKLFIAQLQNQDPMSPQDSSAFVAQLAQLSQLEQATETNTRLQNLADASSSAARASLSDLVGRNVTATADTIEVRAGALATLTKLPSVSVHLDAAASDAKLDIVDASGKTVKSVDLGSAAGDVTVDWSKVGDLPAGKYSLSINGKTSDGAAVTGHTDVSGVIDAMQLGDSGGRFRIGPFNVSPASITTVGASAL